MKTYDPKANIATFVGIQIVGYANEQFMEVTRNTDSYVGVVGADGEFMRARSNDRSGIVNITLLQSSPSNDFLAQRLLLDERANAGFGPLYITDLLGNMQVQSDEAFIMRPADIALDLEPGTRQWAFWCGELIIQNGSIADL